MNTEIRKHRGGAAALLGPLLVVALLQSNPGTSEAQTLVRDLDNPARQPFQAELGGLLFNTSDDAESFQITLVPPGKRLVIEHVSLRINSREAGPEGIPQPRFRTFAALITKADTVAARHEVIVDRADVGEASRNVASQSIRAYADPGSAVFVEIDSTNDNGGNSLLGISHVAISGHLVDLP
jgi:hypothetical protein